MLITLVVLLGAVDGGVPARVQVEERPGPAGEVSGTVVDERGAPVANAKLTFRGGDHHRVQYAEAVTGADGRYSIARVVPGFMQSTGLVVETPGYGRLNESIHNRFSTALTINVRVGKAMKVAGVIAAPDATSGMLRLLDPPPAGGDVTDWRLHATPRATGSLGADGRFSMEVLEGDYELEWRRPSGSRFFARVHAPSGELKFTPSSTAVEGQVLSRTGSPLAAAEVELHVPKKYDVVGVTKTDAQGRYSIPGVEDGEYGLEVTMRLETGTMICRAQQVKVVKGAAKTMTRFGGGWEARGELVDQNGRPLPTVHVLARPLTPSGASMLCDTRAAVTDAAGRFALFELPDGDVELTAMSEPPVTLVVKPGSGPVTLKLPAVLAKRTLTGVVLGPDRKPIEGAMVGRGRNFTDANGRFTLELEPGPAAPVQFYRRCFERKEVDEGNVGTVVMERKPCLAANVVDAAKKPVSGMHSLQLKRADGTMVSQCNTRAAEGDCTLEAELGALELTGTTQDGRPLSTKVTLKDTVKQEVYVTPQ